MWIIRLLAAVCLLFANSPISSAQVPRSEPAVASPAKWVVPLTDATWASQRGWLDNPAAQGEFSVTQRASSVVFRVQRPDAGMKWSWLLPKPMTLQGRRYVAIRYRATGWRPWSDYAVCVMGTPQDAGGLDYDALIPTDELIADGRWHTLNLDVRRLATRFPTITHLAVQLQAVAPDASLELADIRLGNVLQKMRLSDAVSWTAGANFDSFRPVNLASTAQDQSTRWQQRLHLTRWFQQPRITVQGIPFSLLEVENDLAATDVRSKTALRLAVGSRTSEVYVLLLSAMVGKNEPAYGVGDLNQLRDVDRFRLSLEYSDGSADECLPMDIATRQFGIVHGVQVVAAAADPSKELSAVTLWDLCRQAAFAVAAVTLRTEGPPVFPEILEERPPMTTAAEVVQVADGPPPPIELVATVSSHKPFVLQQLRHKPSDWGIISHPCSLVSLRVNGKEIPHDELEEITQGNSDQTPSTFTWFNVRGTDHLVLGFKAWPDGRDRLRITAAVHNRGSQDYRVALVAPILGPYQLCDQDEQSFYLMPRRGSVLDVRPCSFRERYCGLFPVQFLDTFCPSERRGISLRTEDQECLRKNYLLDKRDNKFTIGVEYPERVLGPGGVLKTASAVITATDGDCHHGLNAYRDWLRGWYKPLSPRKPWFREVFNFRQRFLWMFDPAYDSQAGEFKLQQAVDESRREFGGIDYLHLFDWGNLKPYGRIYGRTGDYSPFEMFKGGRTALSKAIADVQSQGVPVGLYIEGYLLQEKGLLGQRYGSQWQLVGRDGQGVYWPQSTEMFMCPSVASWRDVQASTYATKVRELDVDGMYIDQFGFAGGDKDCYSPDHGHPVPSYAVNTERECTRIIRASIDRAKKNVATYTEETPVDVTSQYQDGSFSYAMFSAQRTKSMVPLNIARFALPDFKTIQILFCDKPTGSWATGVRWVFFNGEAIWLEGKADEWFEPETREEIRRCYAILRQHRDAFTTLEPEPIVPTERGGLFANRFPIENKQVFTLYNSRHRTIRGPMLRLARRKNVTYYDAWNKRPADFRQDGSFDVIHSEIGPHGVGCIVVEQGHE